MLFPEAQIITGDATSVMQGIESDSVDLVMFSPPYDAVRAYAGFPAFDITKIGEECLRVVKDGGVAVVIIGDGSKDFAKSLSSFRLAVQWVDVVGWRLFETAIYQRDGKPGAWWRQRFRVDHEYIHIFFKGQRPKTFHKEHMMVPSKNAGKTYGGTQRRTDGSLSPITRKTVHPTKCRGTIWKYRTSNTEGNPAKMQHPATFPDALASDIIRCFTEPGDMVLDPMVGSGTTCVIAQSLGRRSIGIDINPDYTDLARRRVH